ncbi:hypothetical protein BD626DRAFT_425811 [Schizophyllum amplum]|uniref:Uncharacterized protein n=1 Tax=Schizophyllum amplum TaxID=97359 RepID=A0A550CVB9_9AGAR|nr:hypothetical protein BD626DRAFT_425811 [Auriculariopsis ampla]
MSTKIILYDIPSRFGPFSGNSWRTRYALSYKKLPFSTVWVELGDIAEVLSVAGAPTTGTWADGRPKYTVPTIHDPKTSRHVAGGYEIACYLDETYPASPALLPYGTAGLQHLFVDALMDRIVSPGFPAMLEGAFGLFNPSSAAYFRETREKMWGKTLEDMFSDTVAVKKAWTGLKEGLDWLENTIKESGEGSMFLLGSTVTYGDLVIGSTFKWLSIANPERWEEVKKLNGGRWGRFMEFLRQYEDNA